MLVDSGQSQLFEQCHVLGQVHVLYTLGKFECQGVRTSRQVSALYRAPAPVVPLVHSPLGKDAGSDGFSVYFQQTGRTLVLGIDGAVAVGIPPVDGVGTGFGHLYGNGDEDVSLRVMRTERPS